MDGLSEQDEDRIVGRPTQSTVYRVRKRQGRNVKNTAKVATDAAVDAKAPSLRKWFTHADVQEWVWCMARMNDVSLVSGNDKELFKCGFDGLLDVIADVLASGHKKGLLKSGDVFSTDSKHLKAVINTEMPRMEMYEMMYDPAGIFELLAKKSKLNYIVYTVNASKLHLLRRFESQVLSEKNISVIYVPLDETKLLRKLMQDGETLPEKLAMNHGGWTAFQYKPSGMGITDVPFEAKCAVGLRHMEPALSEEEALRQVSGMSWATKDIYFNIWLDEVVPKQDKARQVAKKIKVTAVNAEKEWHREIIEQLPRVKLYLQKAARGDQSLQTAACEEQSHEPRAGCAGRQRVYQEP